MREPQYLLPGHGSDEQQRLIAQALALDATVTPFCFRRRVGAPANPWRALMRHRFAFLRRALALCAFIAGAAGARADAPLVEEAAYIADRYVQAAVAFAPCAEAPDLDCGVLPVPIDYRKPWAGTVGLAVARARATRPDKRIGVLFANPGGPGGSGVDFVIGGVNAPGFIRLRERFDIVSFDVRGSHRSRPVSCVVPPVADPASVPEAQLPALLDQFSRNVAQACLAQNGDFITTLSSNNIARDIDVLRRALGERQISYVGLSHGTVIGSVYATLFAQRLRAMLLDGGVMPSFRDGGVEFRAEQAVSFETVFQRLALLCKADPACRLNGASGPGLVRAMDDVLARLTITPVTSPAGAVLNAAALRRIVSVLLSTESLWPFVVDGLADAHASNYALMFQLLAFVGGNPTAGGASVSALGAILCNDQGTRRGGAEVLPVSDAITALSSHIETRFAVAASVARCAQWPAADVPIIRPLRPHVAAATLLIGNHFDPNTPLSWTRSLAVALGVEQQVVRYQGGGHTAYARFGNSCIDQIGDTFLFDLKLPPEGFSCPARPLRLRPADAALSAGALRALPGSALRSEGF